MATSRVTIESIEIVKAQRFLWVHVHTNTGIVGLGEAGMWAYPEACEAIIRAWTPYILGKDALRIEHLWQYLYRNKHFRGAAVSGALGAIDAALWDIAGKHHNVPVYELLGGRVRDKIRVQTQLHESTIDGLVEKAKSEVARGITALRLMPFSTDFASMRYDDIIREAVLRVGALRETVGDGVDIGVELHRRMSPADAVSLARELEVFRPLYYEDLILPDSIDSAADLAKKVFLPLATGERLHSIYEFRELFASGGAIYGRLDPCLAGGLTAGKKIAAIAEAFHASIMPHGTLSPVATTVAVHLDASIPNFSLQDYLGDDELPKNDLLVENLVLENGYLHLPDKPGLGVELKPDVSQKYPFETPTLHVQFHEDGSVVDL